MLFINALLASFAIVGLAPSSYALPQDASPSGGGGPGQCRNPIIRKEWRTLTTAQKKNWISAVKCLANLPRAASFTPGSTAGGPGIPAYNSSGSYYDDFVYMHIDLSPKIHATGLFLPWHRWYLQVYENTLRTKCGLTTPSPYWDWTKDWQNVQASPIFTDTNPQSGIGGWGNPANDIQLSSGAFSTGFKLSYPVPHRLRRQYAQTADFTLFGAGIIDLPGTFTPTKVNALINGHQGNFTDFVIPFEAFTGPHTGGHFVVGGDLAGGCPAGSPPDCAGGPFWSANEPLFWLHHAMVDKVWYDWQKKHPSNAMAFAGGSVQDFTGQYPTGAPPFLSLSSPMPHDGLGPAVNIGQVMSTTGGFLCYKYM